MRFQRSRECSDAAMRFPSVLDLFLDDLLESLEGLSSGKVPSVDEEGGGGADADRLPVSVVFLDRRPKLPRVDALVEGLGVETDLGGKRPIGLCGERTLRVEQAIVIGPELPLFVRAARGFGCGLRLGMIGERKIPIDQFDPIGLRGRELPDSG